MVGAENRLNLLLQHWHGEPSPVERGSWESMAAYARRVGAEHKILSGELVRGVRNPQMHKLHMLSDQFDDHDVVVMVDSDMFARKGAADIFEASGIGVSETLQKELKESVRRKVPHRFGKSDADFYGGAVYRLTREDRQALRAHMDPGVLRDFDAYKKGCDEGVMHYLATQAGFKGRGLVGGDLWACSSYAPEREWAHFIHIRRRVKEGSEHRRNKTEALQELRRLGVL